VTHIRAAAPLLLAHSPREGIMLPAWAPKSELMVVLRRLFSRPSPAPPAHRPTTGGRLVYAIGDIHGRLDLLSDLIASIRSDAARAAPSERPVLIFIGDYVDRGPQSASVIDLVLDLEDEAEFEVRALKGNHEAQVLAFLEDPRAGPAWIEFGGAETLLSYGVTPPRGRTDEAAWTKTRDVFSAALPARHAGFLRRLELAITCGDYVFVHAGVRPGVPLTEQSEHDLLWIRDEFLRSTRPIEKVVVHGHTPERSPYIGPNRIGIDTGAYATAMLTAVRLLGPDVAFIQTDERRQYTGTPLEGSWSRDGRS
jgi:serine/threonine protein phosphatase 1